MLVFYTRLKEISTGVEIAVPVVTDYFMGDVGEIIKNDHGEEFVITDFAVENFPEGV